MQQSIFVNLSFFSAVIFVVVSSATTTTTIAPNIITTNRNTTLPVPNPNNETNYYEIGRDGRYIMRYETPNGIVHFETGYLRYTAGVPYQVKEGYFIYPTADGKKVRLSYFADLNGYRVISYQIRDALLTADEVEAIEK